MAPTLVLCCREDGSELSIEEGKSFTVGRSLDCDLKLTDLKISLHHCSVTMHSDKILLRDDSTNGTFVNSKKVGKGQETQLKNGDEISFIRGDNAHTYTVRVEGLDEDTAGQSCADTWTDTQVVETDLTFPMDAEEGNDTNNDLESERMDDDADSRMDLDSKSATKRFALFFAASDAEMDFAEEVKKKYAKIGLEVMCSFQGIAASCLANQRRRSPASFPRLKGFTVSDVFTIAFLPKLIEKIRAIREGDMLDVSKLEELCVSEGNTAKEIEKQWMTECNTFLVRSFTREFKLTAKGTPPCLDLPSNLRERGNMHVNDTFDKDLFSGEGARQPDMLPVMAGCSPVYFVKHGGDDDRQLKLPPHTTTDKVPAFSIVQIMRPESPSTSKERERQEEQQEKKKKNLNTHKTVGALLILRESDKEKVEEFLKEREQEEIEENNIRAAHELESVSQDKVIIKYKFEGWDVELGSEEDKQSYLDKSGAELKEDAQNAFSSCSQLQALQNQSVGSKAPCSKQFEVLRVILMGLDEDIWPSSSFKNIGDQDKLKDILDDCDCTATKFRLLVRMKDLPVVQIPASAQQEEDQPSDMQVKVAYRILKRVKFVWKEMNKDLTSYSDVGFIVLVPPQATLFDQTRERLRSQIGDIRCGLPEDVLESPVKMLSGKKRTDRGLSFLRQSVQSNPNKLWVMIVDESHWGTSANGIYSYYVNDNGLLDAENFMILLVSATPYNHLTKSSRIPERYVTWNSEKTEIEDASSQDKRIQERNQALKSGKEQLHVVKWFESQYKRGLYFRLEYFLESVYSPLRHGRCGAPEPNDAMNSDWSLVRSDQGLEDLMPKLQKNKKTEVNSKVALTWLTDFVFEMTYLKVFFWNGEELRDAVAGASMDSEWWGKKAKAVEATFTRLANTCKCQEQCADKITAICELDGAGDFAKGLKKLKGDNLEIRSETEKILRDLLDKKSRKRGHMKMIRVDTIKLCKMLQDGLIQCRDTLFSFEQHIKPSVPFAVLQDTGNLSLKENFSKKGREREFMDFKVQVKTKNVTIASILKPTGKTELVYTDLEDLPCILLLVDRGRKGDTFPQSLDVLDMRMRCSMNFTTFVQEIGRLSRYPCTKTYLDRRDSKAVMMVTKGNKSRDLRQNEELELPEVAIFQPNNAQSLERIKSMAEDCFRSGSRVAVFRAGEGTNVEEVSKHEFVGYATHTKEFDQDEDAGGWIAILRGKGTLSRVSNRKSTEVRYTFKPDRSTFTRDFDDVEGQKCRLILFEGTQMNGRELSYFQATLEIPDDGGIVLTLSRDMAASQVGSKLIKGLEYRMEKVLSFLAIRDVASLDYLLEQCSHGGSLHELEYKIPYALVPNSSILSIQKADEAASESVEKDAQIWNNLVFEKSKTYENTLKAEKENGTLDTYMVGSMQQKKHNYYTYDPRPPEKSKVTSQDEEQSSGGGSCDYVPKDAQPSLHSRRFLLFAECQIGKTGAFLHFLRILREHVKGVSSGDVEAPKSATVKLFLLPDRGVSVHEVHDHRVGNTVTLQDLWNQLCSNGQVPDRSECVYAISKLGAEEEESEPIQFHDGRQYELAEENCFYFSVLYSAKAEMATAFAHSHNPQLGTADDAAFGYGKSVIKVLSSRDTFFKHRHSSETYLQPDGAENMDRWSATLPSGRSSVNILCGEGAFQAALDVLFDGLLNAGENDSEDQRYNFYMSSKVLREKDGEILTSIEEFIKEAANPEKGLVSFEPPSIEYFSSCKKEWLQQGSNTVHFLLVRIKLKLKAQSADGRAQKGSPEQVLTVDKQLGGASKRKNPDSTSTPSKMPTKKPKTPQDPNSSASSSHCTPASHDEEAMMVKLLTSIIDEEPDKSKVMKKKKRRFPKEDLTNLIQALHGKDPETFRGVNTNLKKKSKQEAIEELAQCKPMEYKEPGGLLRYMHEKGRLQKDIIQGLCHKHGLPRSGTAQELLSRLSDLVRTQQEASNAQPQGQDASQPSTSQASYHSNDNTSGDSEMGGAGGAGGQQQARNEHPMDLTPESSQEW